MVHNSVQYPIKNILTYKFCVREDCPATGEASATYFWVPDGSSLRRILNVSLRNLPTPCSPEAPVRKGAAVPSLPSRPSCPFPGKLAPGAARGC